MSIDLGEMYKASRLRITDLATDDVAHLPVPATPLWNVHDLIAHVTGVVTDALSGNIEGAATDPWTAAQVERARDRTVSEMIDEWSVNGPMIEGFLSSPAGEAVSRAVVDIHTHEADLLQALGKPVVLPDQFLNWVAPVLLEDFQSQVAEQGLPPVQVQAAAFEVCRGRLGRRTVDEVRSYSWSADPAPYLDAWFIFGTAQQSLGEVS
jgi:hypothetical protein